MSDPPVACLLTAPELRARRDTALADFRASQLDAREIANASGEGFAFRFAASASRLTALTELIELERQCCPFLRFHLIVEPANGPVWLELTGPPGTRELLAHELGFVQASPAPPTQW
jgi:hypothetical protein